MEKQENAVLTVVGVNDVGILAKTAACIAEANGSVVQVSQIVMDKFFTLFGMHNLRMELCSIEALLCTLHSSCRTVLSMC